MPKSPDKLSFILLALLLIFSPLQNAFAGMDFHASMGTGSHGMTHNDTDAMQMDPSQAMNMDCQHCVDQQGCSDHDCSHTHCTSCAPGLLGFIHTELTTRTTEIYFNVEPFLISRLTSHPFRPPKT